VGTCNPSTGACEASPVADGTSCAAAGDLCRTGGVCTAGVCDGGTSVDCTSLDDACHVGTCDPTTGTCSAVAAARSVDVLFMIDNSNSMQEEQVSLAAELPRFVTALATGDIDGDGMADFPPVRDLHLGVVTSDMGTAGFSVPTCSPPMFGDDGVLRTEGNTMRSGCAATYPSFLTFVPSTGADPATAAADFACVANAGTGGCGFEQQLEAVLKAVTPSTAATRFFGATTGHADGANAGFLRPDSVLVTFLLTDENDCSASDGGLFEPASATYPGDLNLRCFTYPSALHPVTRYVDGLVATRTSPNDLIFVAVTGVPVDLVPSGGATSFAAILADPRMVESIDPSGPIRLVPSCDVPGRGLAFPPRRIVSTAQGLAAEGVTAILGSICQEDLGAPVDAALARIASMCPTP
jgi:hypothetical protein